MRNLFAMFSTGSTVLSPHFPIDSITVYGDLQVISVESSFVVPRNVSLPKPLLATVAACEDEDLTPVPDKIGSRITGGHDQSPRVSFRLRGCSRRLCLFVGSFS